MSRVEEIEEAILSLNSEDFAKIVQRLREIEHERWDLQLQADAAAGKLDFLFEEARTESKKGLLRQWPPSHEV